MVEKDRATVFDNLRLEQLRVLALSVRIVEQRTVGNGISAGVEIRPPDAGHDSLFKRSKSKGNFGELPFMPEYSISC